MATAQPRSRRFWSRQGAQPAGQILVVMVAALLLGALVNADALVARAEQKPLGAARDRALYLWHPVQDIAHVTQLYRLRTLGDALVGNDTVAGTDLAAAVPRDSSRRGVVRPTLRVPTSDDPLRLYIGGDSVVRDAGESFLRLSAEDPLLRTALHYEIATGLSRPDTFDWPATLVGDAKALRPEIAILMFGGNDGQGIVEPDGTVHPKVDAPGWRAEYGRRVAAVMDSLVARDRFVLWVSQPPMRDAGFDARIQVINSIVKAAAKKRPGVRYVDSSRVVGNASGRYAHRLPGIEGDLRQSDGIHLARAGADVLARHLLGVITEMISETATDRAEPSTQDERS